MKAREEMNVQDDIGRVVWFTVLVLALWIFVPNQARADEFWHARGHYHSKPVVFPGNYLTITLGGQKYYHRSGHYYRRFHGRFIEVANPYYVVITNVPLGCRRAYIGGRVYYTNNDVYYEQVTGGYRLVPTPGSKEVIDDIDSGNIAVHQSAADPFTVNIPNNKGGYTAVILKRSGSGYVGPQGEFYAEFPRVEQLRVMYGK